MLSSRVSSANDGYETWCLRTVGSIWVLYGWLAYHRFQTHSPCHSPALGVTIFMRSPLDLVVEALTDVRVTRRCLVGGYALFIYDIILTFNEEWRYIWQAKWTSGKVQELFSWWCILRALISFFRCSTYLFAIRGSFYQPELYTVRPQLVFLIRATDWLLGCSHDETNQQRRGILCFRFRAKCWSTEHTLCAALPWMVLSRVNWKCVGNKWGLTFFVVGHYLTFVNSVGRV